MLLICSIENTGESFIGYIDNGDAYQHFVVDQDRVWVGAAYDKTNFTDYNHYVGVMGKFDPEAVFFEKPIRILNSQLTYQGLQDVERKINC